MSESIHFIALHAPSGELFESAMRIYLDCFPANERQPSEVVHERVRSGKSVFFAAVDQDECVGMAMLWDFKGIPFVLLDYLAIREDRQGTGIGSGFFRFLSEEISRRRKRIVIEVEHPGSGTNTAQRRRRIRFYLDNGAGILQGVPYLLPPLDGTTATDMLLMISPAKDCPVMRHDEIRELIMRLYLELYRRDGQDSLLNSFISQIPESAIVNNLQP